MKSGARNHLLDLVRGVAALLVCLSHLRAATLVDWAAVRSPDWANRALYFVTGLGHQSVVVFFVLSGYLVGGSVLNGRFEWGEYAAARLSRLWTVLLPCLALTFGVDVIVAIIEPGVLSGGYAARWHSTPEPGAFSNSVLTLLGNVLFLQTVAVPVFGSNGPLWSLANEFWYYVLFPVALQAAGILLAPVSGRLAAAALAIALATWLPAQMLLGFVAWLFGVVVHLLHARGFRFRSWLNSAIATGLLLVAFAWSKAVHATWWSDIAIGLPAALLVLVAPRSANLPGQRGIEHLSDISFSLYLGHFPLVLLVGAAGFRAGNLQPTPSAWAAVLAAAVALLTAAHVMWWVFERRTPQVRQAFRRILGLRSLATARRGRPAG